MKDFIDGIDKSKETLEILYIIKDAFLSWVGRNLTEQDYNYIKGYADCKIKQLNK